MLRHVLSSVAMLMLAVSIGVIVKDHLGVARAGTLYEAEHSTFRRAGAAQCLPGTTCPYLVRVTSSRYRWLYVNPSTLRQVRVNLVDPPASADMSQLDRITVTLYHEPCDVKIDETLGAAATAFLLNAALAPLFALDEKRKLRQFSLTQAIEESSDLPFCVRW